MAFDLETVIDEDAYSAALELAAAKKPKEETLGVGSSKHEDVRALQELMGEAGHELEVDGIFGPDTRRAVEAFQKEQGLKVDGVVGEATMKKLSTVKPPKELEGGAEGTDPSIDAIRSFVPSKNMKGAAAATGKAVAKAAKSTSTTPKGPHGGAIDPVTGKERSTSTTGPIGSTTEGAFGKVGKQADKLRGSDAFNEAHPRNAAGEFIEAGQSGEHVARVQKQLNKTGADLKVDGKFGDRTKEVLENFQSHSDNSHGESLAVDGVVGPQTAGALKRAIEQEKA